MKNKCIGFYGPTGSGKTTELNNIAKSSWRHCKVSYYFQDNQLLDDISVIKNIMLPLENLYKKNEAEKIAEEWIKKLDLQGKKESKCSKLSGGEKQRVGLARCFAYGGDFFIFDEPFSAQDEYHKNKIIEYILEIKKSGKDIYIVSHQKKDLELLCDEIKIFGEKSQE